MAEPASLILPAKLGVGTAGFQGVDTAGFQGAGTAVVSPTPCDRRVRGHVGSHSRGHFPCGTRFDRNSLLAVPAVPITFRMKVFGSPALSSPWTGCPGTHSLSLRYHHCISCHPCGLNILCCALQI
jgi:hypothetical protein